MISTLQAAFGAYPTSSSHTAGPEGSLNESFNFGDDDMIADERTVSATSVFKLAPNVSTDEVSFVPPTFLPPGVGSRTSASQHIRRTPAGKRRSLSSLRANGTSHVGNATSSKLVLATTTSSRLRDSRPMNASDGASVGEQTDDVASSSSSDDFISPVFRPPGDSSGPTTGYRNHPLTAAGPRNQNPFTRLQNQVDANNANTNAVHQEVSTRSQSEGQIPPWFVPPSSTSRATVRSQHHSDQIGISRKRHHPDDWEPTPDDVSTARVTAKRNHVSANDEDYATTEGMQIEATSRSPSPSPTNDFEQERQSFWSEEARKSFHDMVTAESYVNRYRMHMKKKQRMIAQLEDPELEITLCDGSKDHQTKYQSANWTLKDGLLYRKPEAGRVGKLRRHLDELEAWEVISREHSLSGHLGRDKLRKRLEQKYIGYTLQEIMFVLQECKRCGGREKNGPATSEKSLLTSSTVLTSEESLNGIHFTGPLTSSSQGPFGRLQASNIMWP